MTTTPPPGCSAARLGPPGLWLRARRVEDADAMTAMTALPLVRHGTLRPPFPDPTATRAWLEKASPTIWPSWPCWVENWSVPPI